jgi:ubiquinone/menaquinone biosynthesis C-methylase UbiE
MERDLGATTSIDVVNDLVSLDGLTVLDVGCGDMTFTRLLAEHGAHATGVDPDRHQAERNRAADPAPNLTFEEAGATALPAADGSVDGVFFSFSLHHVPAETYPATFAEVRRVLKPEGFLCVIEPADCPLNEVMKLFHDESVVRAAAQQALRAHAVPAFTEHATFRYVSEVAFESFDAFATQYGAKKFNTDYTEADIRRPEVEAAFERLGAPDYRFESPKLMMWLRGVKA